jgi:hypothetical protein
MAAKVFTTTKSLFMPDWGAGLEFGHRFEAGTVLTLDVGRDSYWNAFVRYEGRLYRAHLNPLELAQAVTVSRETAVAK